MITTLILQAFYTVISLILSPLFLFDNVVLNANITTAIATAGNYLNMIDQIAPVDDILIILGVFLTIESFIFGYKIIMWLIRKIPTIS